MAQYQWIIVKKNSIGAEAGRKVYQINHEEPINNLVNAAAFNAEVYSVFNQNKYSHTGFRVYLPIKSGRSF